MGIFDASTWKNPLTWIPPVAVANAVYAGAGGEGDIIQGAGNALEGAVDARKVNPNAQGFSKSPDYNPNRFNYGGWDEGANYYTQQAFDEQGREQAIDDYYRQRGEEGQNRRIEGMDLAKAAAEGKAPSAAEVMMKQGLDTAMANQNAQAAGARGAAGIALAQGNANANMANLQQQGNMAAGKLRAEEMAQARGLYGSLGQANRQANDQYELGMGQLAQGRSNNAQGYFGMGMGVQAGQLGANQQQQQMLAGGNQNAQNINAQAQMFNANANKELQREAVGAIGSMGQAGGMGGSK